MEISLSDPVSSSLAETYKIPSASSEKITLIRGIPAGFGGIFERINSPKNLFLSFPSDLPWFQDQETRV